jgi:hypothetical protein
METKKRLILQNYSLLLFFYREDQDPAVSSSIIAEPILIAVFHTYDVCVYSESFQL